ncbi:MAG: phosphoglycerate kinase [bacterium]|nr:phosphoglycerate kinase [bacterium]
MDYKFPVLNEAPPVLGKKVIMRVDLNIPIINGRIADDFRLKKIMPTLEFLQSRQAKTLLISHTDNPSATLEPILESLKGKVKISFQKTIEEAKEALEVLENGSFVLLENIRLFEGEESNDINFAKKLSELGDLYVNEAFSVSHREHASLVGLPKFLPHFAGLLFAEEVKSLSQVFSPEHPFLFVLGGAKFNTKLPLVKKFLDIADTVYVAGALSNDIYKARGLEIGNSSHSENGVTNLEKIEGHQNLRNPIDIEVCSEAGKEMRAFNSLKREDKIVDIGPQSLSELSALVSNAKLIVWNGPLGFYEEGFSKGTEELAMAMALSSAKTIVGGGDTLAAISSLGIHDKFSFVSTGGGAMLDFLANETLPGIEALQAN